MTSDDLAPVIGAMTERPWTRDECIIDCGPGAEARRMLYNTDTVTPLGPNADGNLAGVVALANHADALVELVRACERLRDTPNVYEVSKRMEELMEALAKVHAVGRESKDA